MYNSLKKKFQIIVTAIAQRFVAMPEAATETKLDEINALIATNIPRTRKEKNNVFVWTYNVAKEFVV